MDNVEQFPEPIGIGFVATDDGGFFIQNADGNFKYFSPAEKAYLLEKILESNMPFDPVA